MAHECPECGMKCHCGGDIDDIVLNDDRYVNRCTCCDDEDDEDSEGYYDGDYYFDE